MEIKRLLFIGVFVFLFGTSSFAEKITILYTGQTHAALYHCDCPKEPDGGLARRMAKVKELRLANPNTLLVDAGGFFSGGALDQHSQGVELDKRRNELNLEALNIIGYDALSISDDEFNFGTDYLLEKIKKSKAPFLSANLKLNRALPYIIKKIAKANVAIIGLTGEQARAKSGGLELEEALSSLSMVIQDVKSKGADIIVVLSSLGEDKDKVLLSSGLKDAVVLITSRPIDVNQPSIKVGSSIILHASWQGRRLGKIDLELDASQIIKDFKVEEIRLSDEIPDAPEITRMLPQCFADSDCRKAQGLSAGSCNNPGKIDASCSYANPKSIELLVINRRDSRLHDEDKFIAMLKPGFPGLYARFVAYDSDEGKAWIAKLQVNLLPVYLLSKGASGEANFARLERFTKLIGDYYYLNPEFCGGSFFLGREKIPKRLDVFLGAKGNNLQAILYGLRELQLRHNDLMINVHFLASEGKDGFTAQGGLSEVEEYGRQLCIQRHFPDKFWDYAICRAKNQDTSWWDSCLEGAGIGIAEVKKCSLSPEALDSLRENTMLNRELNIMSGPTFLMDNQEIFTVEGIPSAEDFEKLLGLK